MYALTNFKVFVNVSHRAFSLMCSCASPVAARTSFLTRKTDITTSRKKDGATFGTYEGTVHEPYPLSQKEAFSFVENVLGLEHPDTLCKKDPLQNLIKIVERIKKVSPFSTMHFFDGSVLQINDEYCKRQMLLGHGGSCIFINPFTKALLEHLGYRTRDVTACTSASPDCFHVGTLVYDLSYSGSLHLVEPGTVRPIFHPISLDFEQESPVFEGYGLRDKFFKRKDGNLVWCMEPSAGMLRKLGDHEVMQDLSGEKWQIFLIYLLQKKMARYHFNRYWHRLIRQEGYIPPRTNGFVYNTCKDNRLVNVFAGQHKIFVSTIQEDLTKQDQELSKGELLRFFEKNFPGFPTRMVERAIRDNFQMSQVHTKEA